MMLRDLNLSRDMLIIFQLLQTLNIHWAMITHDVNDSSLVESSMLMHLGTVSLLLLVSCETCVLIPFRSTC
jgi:hypothetical protein